MDASRARPKKPPLIVILGPTASGKSELAIKLAKRFNGEIVSADSRQIYQEMDIGTNKIQNQSTQINLSARPSTKGNLLCSGSKVKSQNDHARFVLAKQGGQGRARFVLTKQDGRGRARFALAKQDGQGKSKLKNIKNQKYYIANGICHHLIDIVNPDQEFTLAQYKKLAIKTIREIHQRGKLPFLVGGTGLYIWAVVDNLQIPKVKPKPNLRAKIEKEIQEKGLKKVYQKLLQLDPEARYFVEPNNLRRIIRALEVCLSTGQPFSKQRKKGRPLFNVCQIGLKLPQEILHKKINQRVEKMIQTGLVNEVRNLAKKYSWHLPSMSSIGYQEIGQYLLARPNFWTLPSQIFQKKIWEGNRTKKSKKLGGRGKISLDQAKELIKQHTRQYARRQMSWFKRDQRIKWIKNSREAERLIGKFLY